MYSVNLDVKHSQELAFNPRQISCSDRESDQTKRTNFACGCE